MNLRIECIKDIETAKVLWNKFSPQKTIFDSWDFRYCFYKYIQYELFFYVGYIGEEAVGLFPLQYHKYRNHLEPFGGSYMYDVRVFIKSGFEECIPKFYMHLTLPCKIIDIIGDDEFTSSFPFSNYKFVLPLKNFKNVDEYLEKSFQSKDRTNLKRRVKLMASEVTVEKNNFADLEILIQHNLESFGQESNFHKPFRREIFQSLLETNLDIQMFTFFLQAKKECVSLSIKYNDIYHYINLGLNKGASSHLWTYVTMYNIDHALSLGCSEFDAGMESFTWKEKWNFSKVPEYKYNTCLEESNPKASV
jgi:hypothetical protein